MVILPEGFAGWSTVCLLGTHAPQSGVIRKQWKLELPRLRSQAGAWERATSRPDIMPACFRPASRTKKRH